MDVLDKPVIRKSQLFDSIAAFNFPMMSKNTNLYNARIPAPHLETFLTEVSNRNPALIESDFVALLYSVSKEDIDPNDEQIIYAKMLAYGFCTSPDDFIKNINVLVDSNGMAFLGTHPTIKYDMNANTAVMLAKKIFGMDAVVADYVNNSQVLPSPVIIRLAQIGILNIDSIYRHEYRDDNIFNRKYQIGNLSRLSVHKLSLDIESDLLLHVSNPDIVNFLAITNETQLIVSALNAGAQFKDVIFALVTTKATPEEVLLAKSQHIDNSLLDFLVEGI